jgi:transcriptional regulator NrdR family protein
MFIEKRNGLLEPFNRSKITKAIDKAFIDVDGRLYETDTANDIAAEIERDVATSNKPVHVE